MGLMYATVVGYMIVLAITMTLVMYFLVKAFDSSQSVTIDPKPETNY